MTNNPDGLSDARASLEQQAHEWRTREVQAIGAAISTRSWHAVEQAYNSLRDKMDRAGCWHEPKPLASKASVEPQEWGDIECSSCTLPRRDCECN